VTWYDAIEFCNLLSERDGRRPCYRLSVIERDEEGFIRGAGKVEVLKDGTGYRLPSEAEWEYCARAGTTTRYSFGDDDWNLGEYAWFGDNSGGRPHPVGEKKPNPWGIYDMHGLAWEWCEDVWHDNYLYAPTDGSAWRTGGEQNRRVARGGSYGNHTNDCRSAALSRFAPENGIYFVGFRVVLVSP
jgi:formylglycine-generating enzyme required for sulfatase activity